MGLYTAGRFGDTFLTIFEVRGLAYPSDQLLATTARGVGASRGDLPCVKVPLSDWALKYTSTIWHQPPGRVTLNISAMYCRHLLE